MILSTRVLGLTVMAVFIAGVASAPAASAAPKLTVEGGGSATLDITEIDPGADINGLTAFGRVTQCPGTTYTGHEINSKVNGVPNNATTATITPSYARCTVSGGLFATMSTNGCDFVLHINETEPAGTYPVTTDIVCPDPNVGIHKTVYSNEAHTSQICTYEITPQTGLKGAHVVNEAAFGATKNDIRITGTFGNIHIHRTGLCIFDGQGTTTATAVLDIDVTVKGTSAAQEPRGITVSD